MFDTSKYYTRLSVDDIDSFENISIINNFIISDGYKQIPNILSGYPFIVDGIAFLIILSGTGKIKINHREYIFEKNKIMTALPGFIVEIIEQSDDFLVEHLFLSVDFLADLNILRDGKLADKIEERPSIKISEEDVHKLLDYHSFIVRRCKQKTDQRKAITKNLLNAMLIEVSSMYSESSVLEVSSASQHEQIFNDFIKLLYKHIKYQRTVSFYADLLCLSPKYLGQIVKNVSGKLASEWITDYTVLLIKAMLKSSSITVSQLSDELNFPNASFLGRYFKKYTGFTPIEYRHFKKKEV